MLAASRPLSKRNRRSAAVFTGRGAAWSAHLLWEQGVAGSNPAVPTTGTRDAQQAIAEPPRRADERAAAAVGVQGAQQQAVEAVQQERGGLLGILHGELAGFGASGDEPDQGCSGLFEGFVLGDLGGVEQQVVQALVGGGEVVHLGQER